MLKRICLVVAVCLVYAAPALALPALPPQLLKALDGNKDYKGFLDTFNGMKAKCELCHKPGGDKKAKDHALNDFGAAFGKSLDTKAFKDAVKEKKDDELQKLFKAAWEKAAAEKNAEGMTYGEIMKSGKLPGKN